MRVAVSVLAAITVGLAVIFAIPAFLLMRHADEIHSWLDALLPAYLGAIVAAPIWMPLAPIFAAWAYYSCYAKLSVRNESSQAVGAGALPGWKVFRATIVLYLVMAAY